MKTFMVKLLKKMQFFNICLTLLSVRFFRLKIVYFKSQAIYIYNHFKVDTSKQLIFITIAINHFKRMHFLLIENFTEFHLAGNPNNS